MGTGAQRCSRGIYIVDNDNLLVLHQFWQRLKSLSDIHLTFLETQANLRLGITSLYNCIRLKLDSSGGSHVRSQQFCLIIATYPTPGLVQGSGGSKPGPPHPPGGVLDQYLPP